MFTSGLVSVSFRKESPESIIAAATQAGLQGIEWGGDVHVPCGDIQNAKRVRALNEAAGLQTLAYGSYYRLGDHTVDFSKVLETAQALGTSVIRIWGGSKASWELTQKERDALVREAQTLAEAADKKQITITLECHGNTLTDHWESAKNFLSEVNHPRMQMYWQPNQMYDLQYNLSSAEQLADHTVNIHVFHWDSEKRYPLNEGTADWTQYLNIFRKTGKDYGLLLEFMHDDRLESLKETAQTLFKWITA